MNIFHSTTKLLSLTLLLIAASETNGITQLDSFGTITYDGYGMPTRVPVDFHSDFTVNQNGMVGTAYIACTMIEGNAYYRTNNPVETLTITDDASGPPNNDDLGTVAISLRRSDSDHPGIGEFNVTLDVRIMYRSTPTVDAVMYQKFYSIIIERQAEVTTHELTTGEFADEHLIPFEPPSRVESNSVDVGSPIPGDLDLEAIDGPFESPDPIVLIASTTNADYKIWLDTSRDVKVYNDDVQTTLLYKWPADLVDATATAYGPASNILQITLNSVPASLYSADVAYVFLTVKLVDTTARDLRRLRVGIRHDGRTMKEEESTAEVSAKVEFAGSGGPSGGRSSSIISTAATLVGSTLLVI